jgi:hypothetical protein
VRRIGDDRIESIVVRTLEAKPADATNGSTGSIMAKALGVSTSTVHRTETFKLSTDPQFVEKVRDIIGLCLSPPQNALVVCVDEKSQIQTPDRPQPVLPMRMGQVRAAHARLRPSRHDDAVCGLHRGGDGEHRSESWICDRQVHAASPRAGIPRPF